MQKRIKVRFNLSAGKNFMKWKIEYPDRRVEYHDPNEVQILMRCCELRNQRTTAEKILAGAHKTVCAWILCNEIQIRTNKEQFMTVKEEDTQVKYNPRKLPYWFKGPEHNPTNLDKTFHHTLITEEKKLFRTVALPELV